MSVTLTEVARHAGVSLATASRALNGSARAVSAELSAKVRASAAALGYVPNAPAQALARSTTADPVERPEAGDRRDAAERLASGSPFFDARSGAPAEPDRLDLDLLRNGHVHRFRSAATLETVVDRLRLLGYLVHRFGADGWHDERAMHRELARRLSLPGYYGQSLDAFNDVLRDIAVFSYGSDPATTGTVLVLTGYDAFHERFPRTAEVLLDVFAHQARGALLGLHPMLCLLDGTHAYPPVGATDVDSA